MIGKASQASFEQKAVRRVWDDLREEWYFNIADVVVALTDTSNPQDYMNKLRARDEELGKGYGQIVHPLTFETAGGPQKMNAATLEGIFRIIQSIPSPKAEPFKLWLAKVGYERVEETEDPEKAMDRAMKTYLQKGYSRAWINQRLKSIEVRKELTDEWENAGVKKGPKFSTSLGHSHH
jgi:prophage antirepressor-like protein